MKTNLLALETMLSRNSSAGKDSMDRGAETPFTAPPFKEVRISSIKQETHFAPGMMQSPILQIAGHIDRDLRSAAIEAVQQPSDDPRPGDPSVCCTSSSIRRNSARSRFASP